MKKLITFTIILLIIVIGIIYFTYGKEILTLLDEKKDYNVENIKITNLSTLEEYSFFSDGVITYNNQKIIMLDYNNNKLWENIDKSFSNQVFITDNYIFRNTSDKIRTIDKNNQEVVLTEIQGEILIVSRENNKTYMINKSDSGQNLLYILDDSNELLVDNKIFNNLITSTSISDKSEGYSIITLKLEGGSISNTVYFNLLDDVELWSVTIKDEILIKTQISNNNVIVIGTKNLYYYNTNGKLMWKNGIYNKISDYKVSKDNQRIYILYDKGTSTELIAYNFEGKIEEINEAPEYLEKFKVVDDKIYAYNENSIYLLHGNKADKIYDDSDNSIRDFIVKGNDIRILSKDKLVWGQVK